MKKLLVLLLLDVCRLRNWFKTHSGIKIIVFFGFFLVVLFIIAIEYLLASNFFLLSSAYEQFGKAVADYSLNSAFLVLFIFGTVSSIGSASGALYKPNFLKFLMSSPLEPEIIFLSRLLFSFFGTLVLLFTFLAPPLYAYYQNFPSSPDYFLRSLLVIFILAVSSHNLGSILSLLLTKKFKKISGPALLSLFSFALFGSFALLKFLFPPEFFRLHQAADWQEFSANLGKLPLLSTLLPTNWLTKTITSSWSAVTVYALLSAFGIAVLTYLLGKAWYQSSWMQAQETRFIAGKPVSKNLPSVPLLRLSYNQVGLTLNELIGILRTSSDLFYLAFLFSLTVVLLILVKNIPRLLSINPENIPFLISFSFAGLCYLFMTLSLRIIYPSMAKEKKTAWYLFSLPLHRLQILRSKMTFALLISFPAILMGIIAALLVKTTLAVTFTFCFLFSLTTIVISLSQLFFGVISPNFSESDNPDASGTSGSGMAAIVFSLLFILLSSTSLYFLNLGPENQILLFLLNAAAAFLLLAPLYLLAGQSLKNYNL